MELKELVQILNEGGYITELALARLVKDIPGIKLGIKFGCSLRTLVRADEVQKTIEERYRINPDEYVREVFICADDYDKLREVFGIE